MGLEFFRTHSQISLTYLNLCFLDFHHFEFLFRLPPPAPPTVRALEKVKGSTQLQANYSSSDSSLYTNPKGSAVSAFDGGSDSSSESEVEEPPNRKKLRMEAS